MRCAQRTLSAPVSRTHPQGTVLIYDFDLHTLTYASHWYGEAITCSSLTQAYNLFQTKINFLLKTLLLYTSKNKLLNFLKG